MQRIGRVGRLKPEAASEYIHLHSEIDAALWQVHRLELDEVFHLD